MALWGTADLPAPEIDASWNPLWLGGSLCSVWAWMYFVYLTVFFVIRERIDDRHCAGKYGELWTQYQAKVRYRLVSWDLLRRFDCETAARVIRWTASGSGRTRRRL